MAERGDRTLGYSVESGLNQIKTGVKAVPYVISQDLLTTFKGKDATIDKAPDPFHKGQSQGETLRKIAAQQAMQQALLQQKYGYDKMNTVERTAADIGSGITNMAPALGLALIPGAGPLLSLGSMGLMAAGTGATQAINEGANLSDAATYGLSSGGKEVATELIGGGLPLLPGLVKGGKVVGQLPKLSPTTRKIAGEGIDILLEAGEEVASEATDPYLQRNTYNPEAENASEEELVRAGLLGGLTAGALKGAAGGVNMITSRPGTVTPIEPPKITAENATQVQANARKEAELAQKAQEAAEAARRLPAIIPSKKAQNAPENRNSEVNFYRSGEIDLNLQGTTQKVTETLPMEQRTFENVGNKKVKAYQQENPAVRPFYRETATNLLADLQQGVKGGKDVGINPETRNVTTRGGWQRQQSEPINQMLNDGMSYQKIEDGLQRIIEDYGKENTANAKRAELYVHDATVNGYQNVMGEQVQPNSEFAYRGQTLEQLQELNKRLDESFTGDPVKDAAIIRDQEAVQNLMRKQPAPDIRPELKRPEQKAGSMITRKNPTEQDMEQITPEYQAAVDGNLLQFVERVKHGDKTAISYKLGAVSKNATEDIASLTGINTTGFNRLLSRSAVEHIEKRHGENGKADRSMKDSEDIARMQYVMDHYDTIEKLDEVSGSIMDKNNQYAPLVKYAKRVNGTYYVVEAVPDTKAKTLRIVSAYQQKKASRQVADADGTVPSPQPDVLNAHAPDAFNNSNIAQQGSNVNAPQSEPVQQPSGIDYSTLPDYDLSTLSKEVLDFYEQVGELGGKVHFNVRIVEGMESDKNAQWDGNGTIYLNGHKLTDEATIRAITAHEIYHAMKGTDEFGNLQDLAIEYLTRKEGKTREQLLKEKTDFYAAYGISLNEDAAFDEITAAFMEEALIDSELVFRIGTEQPGLYQRIKQWISDMLAKVRKLPENELARAQEKTLLEAQRLYSEGLYSMQYRGQKQQEAEDVRYSLSKPAKLPTPEVQQQNLQNFMANSKVKNEDGSPKVVYSGHGNTNLFGSFFDPKKATAGGFYFTDNPDIASSYASEKFGSKEDFGSDKYRFRNEKGDYKLSIKDIMLTPEQVELAEEFLEEEGSGGRFDDYFEDNKRYDDQVAAWRYTGGARSLSNLYEFCDLMGDTANGFNYKTGKQMNTTFEDMMDAIGLNWDSFQRQRSGVFPVYLNITNPLDTRVGFPADLLAELEYAASKDKKQYSWDELNRLRWTKDYPLKEWVNDIKREAEEGTTGWATHVPAKAKKIMLEMGYDGIIDTGGKGGGEAHTVYIALNPTQVKSAIGNRGTFDASQKDMRYSLNSKSRLSDMVDQYGAIPAGENPTGTNRDVQVPKQTNDSNKVSQTARTGMEARQVEDKTVGMIEDELKKDMSEGRFTYHPISDNDAIGHANQKISLDGWEKSGDSIHSRVQDGERINKRDIATLELCLLEAQKAGKFDKAVDYLADIAIIGRESGQNSQAIHMLKRLSPEGQLLALKATQRRINNSLVKSGKGGVSEIGKETAQEFLKARGNKKRGEIWDKEIERMANETEGTWLDKLNAIRYASMLSGTATHVRNCLSNCAMQVAKAPTSAINAALEDVAATAHDKILPNNSPMARTRTLRSKSSSSDIELIAYARKRWHDGDRDLMLNQGNRYEDVSGQFVRNQRVFGHSKAGNFAEKITKSVSNALTTEDMAFKYATYLTSLTSYMRANGISVAEANTSAVKDNGASIEKGVQFAFKEAAEATFTEDNKAADLISNLEKGLLGGVLVGGSMPFKKTPLNIMKRGVSYSPVGLAMTAYKLQDAVRTERTEKHYNSETGKTEKTTETREPRYTVNDVLHSLSENIMGTALMGIGYALASAGALTATGNDDDKRKSNYDSQMGDQNFAVVMDDGSTYTIDWMAPAAMPMMAGVAAYEAVEKMRGTSASDESNVSIAMDALSKIADPVFEMSCMQGVANSLKSFSGDSGDIASTIGTNIALGYAGQFVPAPLGALARTMDDTVRSTYDSGDFKGAKKWGRQQRNKIPGMSMQNEASIDVWGNERKREHAGDDAGDYAMRFADNFISPGRFSSNKRTALDDKLTKLYEATGDSGVLPTRPTGTVTYDNQKCVLTALEYTRLCTTQGQKSQRYASDFVGSSAYKNLDDTTKADIVGKLYKLAGYEAKKEALKKRGINYSDKGYENALESGVKPYEYYTTRMRFGGKFTDYEDAKKYAEYADKMGMKDSKYTAVCDGLSKLKADKTKQGKTVKDSRKKKVVAYLNNELRSGNITKEQWYYFYTLEYSSQAKNAPYAWIREANKKKS